MSVRSNRTGSTSSRYGQNGKVTALRMQVILSVRIGLPALQYGSIGKMVKSFGSSPKVSAFESQWSYTNTLVGKMVKSSARGAEVLRIRIPPRVQIYWSIGVMAILRDCLS